MFNLNYCKKLYILKYNIIIYYKRSDYENMKRK